MQKTVKKGRKVLSVLLSVLMILSMWVFASPASAADETTHNYKVRVYGRIFDDCDPGLLVGGTYDNDYISQIVTDHTSAEYGKPAGYAWHGSTKTNLLNTAGITLFYDGGQKYVATDMTDRIENANLTKEPVFTDLKEQPELWPYEYPENEPGGSFCLEYDLDSMPTEVFWLVDYNEKFDGTSFGIYKITLENAEGQEVSLWEGLTGARSDDQCYYGSITPGGLKICWDDATVSPSSNEHYALYTRTMPGTWKDYVDPNAYNGYPVNVFANGGVSVVFSDIENNYANNLKYLEKGSDDNYYVNVVNHSTQNAVVSLNNSSYITNYTDNVTIPVGESKAWKIDNSKLTEETVLDFTATYTLDGVVGADGTAAVFTQPAFISVSHVAETAETPAITLENTVKNDVMKFTQQFQADYGIFEEASSTTGNGTNHVEFDYNYYVDLDGLSDWGNPMYFRMYVDSDSDHRIWLQHKDKSPLGTMSITTDDANATLKITNLVETYNGKLDGYPENAEVTASNSSTTPKFKGYTGTRYGCLWNDKTVAWFRFEGKPFKPSATATEVTPSGIISFNNFMYEDYEGKQATFSGDINVFSFDKSVLKEYLKDIAGQGTNWAPMSARYDEDVFAEYTAALENAMTVLGKQKTTQAEIIAAKNRLDLAANELLKKENLVNQVADITYTLYKGDVASEVDKSVEEYTLLPLGATVLSGKEAYANAETPDGTIRKMSAISTNYTESDTAIDTINYRYWFVYVSGVDPAIEKAETALNAAEPALSEEYAEAITDAKNALEAIDKRAGTDSPATQAEIDNAVAYVDTLIAHESAYTELQNLIENGGLTEAEKEKAQEILDANKLPEDEVTVDPENPDSTVTVTHPTVDDKDVIEDATAALLNEVERINNAGDSAIKPDYKTAEDNLAAAKELANNTADLQDGVNDQITALETELQAIKDKKDPEATKATNQTDVDRIASELKNIIDGINNGSLKKPDYTPYNDAIAAYNALLADEDFGGVMSKEDIDAINGAKTTVEAWKLDTTLTAQKNADIKAQADIITGALTNYENCANGTHTWSEEVAYTPAETPTVNNVGTYTETCENCGKTQETIAKRADYTALTEAKRALDAIDTSKLTDTAKADVDEAKANYDKFDKNLPATVTSVTGKTFTGGESEIAALVAEISNLAQTTNAGIADGTLVKPDYSKIDPLIKIYENIKDSIAEGTEDRTTGDNIVTTIAAYKANPDATAAMYQENIDRFANDLESIIDKHAGCAQGNHKWGDPVYAKVEPAEGDVVGRFTYECTVDGCGAKETVDALREDYSTLDDEKTILNNLLTADLTDTAKAEIETALAQAAGTATGDAASGNLDQNLPAVVTGLKGETLDNLSKKTIERFEDTLQAVIDKYADADGNPKANATKDYTVTFDDSLGTTQDVTVKKGETAVANAANFTKAPDDSQHYAVDEATLTVTDVEATQTKEVTYIGTDHSFDDVTVGERPTVVDGECVITFKCTACGKDKTVTAKRADYSAYDTNLANLNALLENPAISDEYKTEIRNTIASNTVADNLINTVTNDSTLDDALDEQSIVTGAATNLGNKYAEFFEDGVLKDEFKKTVKVTFWLNEAHTNSEVVNVIYGGTAATTKMPEAKSADKDYHYIAKKFAEQTNVTDNIEVEPSYEYITHDYTVFVGIVSRPRYNAQESSWSKGVITKKCEGCDKVKQFYIDRADYTAYDALKTALEAYANKNLTAENQALYNEAEALLARIQQDYIATEQDLLDSAVSGINVRFNEIIGALEAASNSGTLEKPNYSEAEEKLQEAKEISGIIPDETTVPGVKDEAKEDIERLEDELEAIKKKIPEATGADQPAIDKIADELQKIIDGIIDGTLVDGINYDEYDDVREEYEELLDTYGDLIKSDAVEDAEEIDDGVEKIKDNPAITTKEGQRQVDEAKEDLEDIVAGIINGSLRNPDYTEADKAISEAQLIDILSEEDEKKLEDLKDMLQEIKDKTNPEANARDNQERVDTIANEVRALIDSYANCINGNHDYRVDIVAPTCCTEGFTGYVCKICQNAYKDSIVPATGNHNWSHADGESWIMVESSSCREQDYEYRYCRNEGCLASERHIFEGEYGPHTLVIVEGFEASCTIPGKTNYERCIKCTYVQESQVIPAFGHADKDGNNVCDHCNEYIVDPGEVCTCLCHSEFWFTRLIFNFINFFYKLFKINQTCECGAVHW